MQVLPVIPGLSPQRMSLAIDDLEYLLDLVWNERDECWFLDVYQGDSTAIFHGAKVVLGAYIGRIHRHPLLSNGAFIAVDTSQQLVDASFDDFGRRVLLVYVPAIELVTAKVNEALA